MKAPRESACVGSVMGVLVGLFALALAPGDLQGRGLANAPPSRVRPLPPAEDPSLRLVVQLQPPRPVARPRKPARPVPRVVAPVRRMYAGFSRRATPLYLRDRPGGRTTMQLRVGLEMLVLKAGPEWSRVETAGLIRVSGWVQSIALGMRVRAATRLYDRPGGKSIGTVAAGQLVHVARVQRGYALVRLMGYLPLECWIKRADLSTKPVAYHNLRSRYPGGSPMVISGGPLHRSSGGQVIARVADEGRVYRVKIEGPWSQVAVYDYARVDLRAWVPTSRLRWGGYPYYGSGYSNYNCKVGTSGSQVALSAFEVYAARDDAWPTVRILPDARFNVAPDRDGWLQIQSTGCIQLTAYATERPGDWAPAHLIRR